MLSWVGLGSNLGDSALLLRSALCALSGLAETELVAVSPFYRSKALRLPCDSQEQPDYCNAVAALQTDLAAQDLLDALLRIEIEHGRDRRDQRRWQSRSLDLDLLSLGQQRVQTQALHLPHPELHKRDFVLQPWLDVAPGQCLPEQGELANCLRNLAKSPLHSWAHAIPLS